MKRLRSVLPLHTISELYYPLIQIDYCLSVWVIAPKLFIYCSKTPKQNCPLPNL